MEYFTGFQSTHPVWGGTMPPYRRPSTPRRFQSTHPVWGGTSILMMPPTPAEFQSTHPVWGGTSWSILKQLNDPDFNPPTPYGVGPATFQKHKRADDISIHPPRMGWDWSPPGCSAAVNTFQSTHPVWGGTTSIRSSFGASAYFNPPTPYGVGRQKCTENSL